MLEVAVLGPHIALHGIVQSSADVPPTGSGGTPLIGGTPLGWSLRLGGCVGDERPPGPRPGNPGRKASVGYDAAEHRDGPRDGRGSDRANEGRTIRPRPSNAQFDIAEAWIKSSTETRAGHAAGARERRNRRGRRSCRRRRATRTLRGARVRAEWRLTPYNITCVLSFVCFFYLLCSQVR